MSPMLEGVLTLLVGIIFGRVLPAGRRDPKRPSPTAAICGCGHDLHDHDPESKHCYGTTEKSRYSHIAQMELPEDLPCACRQYIGPNLLPAHTAEVSRPGRGLRTWSRGAEVCATRDRPGYLGTYDDADSGPPNQLAPR